MAFKRVNVLQKNGLSDPKSYIAPGDLCDVAEFNYGFGKIGEAPKLPAAEDLVKESAAYSEEDGAAM